MGSDPWSAKGSLSWEYVDSIEGEEVRNGHAGSIVTVAWQADVCTRPRADKRGSSRWDGVREEQVTLLQTTG